MAVVELIIIVCMTKVLFNRPHDDNLWLFSVRPIGKKSKG